MHAVVVRLWLIVWSGVVSCRSPCHMCMQVWSFDVHSREPIIVYYTPTEKTSPTPIFSACCYVHQFLTYTHFDYQPVHTFFFTQILKSTLFAIIHTNCIWNQSLLRFFFGEFCHAILFWNLKCCTSSWRHPRAISGLRIWYGASVSIIIANFRNNSPYLLLVSAYHIALIFTAFYSKQLLFIIPPRFRQFS